MTGFLCGDRLWKAISNRARSAHRTKAAIAYLTRSLPLRFKREDVLIVDATEGAILSGQTSASELEKLLKKGLHLFSHNGLHAKVIILDSELFVSSANLSDSSMNRLFEAGIYTDNPNTVSEAVGMIERLIETSTPIDENFVARIKALPVVKTFRGGASKARATPGDHRPAATWLMGVHEIDEPKNVEELKRIERGTTKAERRILNTKSSTAWIRVSRRSRIAQARQGDNLIIIDRERAKSSPRRVYHHAPVLLVQEEPNCTRIFYEDLPSAEKKSLSWLQFKKVLRLASVRGTVSKDTTRQLSDKVSADINDSWEIVRKGKIKPVSPELSSS